MNTEVENALIQLKKLTDLYLAIFGENSLDRVIYMDPLYGYELSEIEKGPTANCRSLYLVRLEGLEPSRAYAHHPLKMAWHLTHIYKTNKSSSYLLY